MLLPYILLLNLSRVFSGVNVHAANDRIFYVFLDLAEAVVKDLVSELGVFFENFRLKFHAEDRDFCNGFHSGSIVIGFDGDVLET